MMSAALQIPGGFFHVPEVSQAEIDSFHDAHFSHTAVELFDFQFFRPENAQDNHQHYEEHEEYYEEEEDDGLGYYPDGVKRTLTDEQIAIFRHSERESLRRIEAKAAKLRKESAILLQAAKDEDVSHSIADLGAPLSPSIKLERHDGNKPKEEEEEEEGEVQDGSEDGEIETEQPPLTKAEARRQKKQRKRKKLEQRKFNPEKKPDLRKRTWDVVEAGMDSLDYDELDGAHGASTTPAAQRRRISYDD